MNDDFTLLPYHSGSVECRICGLKFLPELEEDQELHQHEHLRFLRGGLPYELREFIKAAGWEAAHCEDGVQGDEGRRQQEIAKRVVAFSYWTREISNGIPENEFESFMAEMFAFIDASRWHRACALLEVNPKKAGKERQHEAGEAPLHTRVHFPRPPLTNHHTGC